MTGKFRPLHKFAFASCDASIFKCFVSFSFAAYGSYCPPGEPAFCNSLVVAFSNSLFSIISGFAVFASLGHLSFREGVPVEELDYGGFSLVFGKNLISVAFSKSTVFVFPDLASLSVKELGRSFLYS